MIELPEPEIYTPERIAEFLLNNSLSEREYRENLAEVLALGVDPTSINPDFLERTKLWQRAESHPDILRSKRSS